MFTNEKIKKLKYFSSSSLITISVNWRKTFRYSVRLSYKLGHISLMFF